MATTAVEKQIDDEISKFYLESLESLQIRDMDDKCDEFIHFYCDIREKIEKYTKYRALKKLGPILIYLFLKTRGILLVLPEFLDLYQMKYGEFTTDLKIMLRYYPEYKARDKKFIIKEYIATVLKSFYLDENLNLNALTLFDHFYPLIQYTKEEVIAALICVLTMISFDLYEVNMKKICDRAGIRQSSLKKYFLEIIFPYLGIPNKNTPRTSFELIRDKIRKEIPLGEIKKIKEEDKIKKHLKVSYPSKLVSTIIELRRERMSIQSIAQEVDVSVSKARIILQKHFLGYQDFSPINKLRELTPITPELISQIINLRRQYTSIKDISKKVGLSKVKTEEILYKKFLGYQQFDPSNVKITPKMINSIIRLKNEKYSSQDIADVLGFSVFIVNKILKEHKKEKEPIQRKLTIPVIFAVVEMWSVGFSILKITKLMELPRAQIIDILERKLGDYQNYKIRFRITQKEIDTACQLRQKGFSYLEIARKLNRHLKLTKKIIKKNLKDYTKYEYITPKNRLRINELARTKQVKAKFQTQNKAITPQIANIYMSYEPVVQLFNSFLEDIKKKESKKTPLNRLPYLLLNNEDQIKRNISKLCEFLSKMNIFRTEKTILSLVLVLSFPQIPQVRITTLIGVSGPTIRNNLAIKNIKKNFGLVIKEQIDIDLIFEHLERINNAIQNNKLPQVKIRLLEGLTIYSSEVNANINKIVRILKEKKLYKEELLILATAIFISCPFVNRIVASEIIYYSLNVKVNYIKISKLLKEISIRKMYIYNRFLLFKHLGRLLEEQRTDTLCVECGNFIYVQLYQDNKKVFICKHCLERER